MLGPDVRCDRCVFWQRVDAGAAYGYCRFRAPKPWSQERADGNQNAFWPKTMLDDWCGSFKRKVAE